MRVKFSQWASIERDQSIARKVQIENVTTSRQLEGGRKERITLLSNEWSVDIANTACG
ncbi:hypothetical protein FORC9_2261 [Vibrio vulnificus]|nr:hypothetical protein FORC9_2261 [Vibrio vulnificus]ANH62422.1 sugar ABC transporter ATPase [Vibrio vulnificus]